MNTFTEFIGSVLSIGLLKRAKTELRTIMMRLVLWLLERRVRINRVKWLKRSFRAEQGNF